MASSNRPTLSGDGRFVAFESNASNLVAGDSNNTTDVFVKDLQTDNHARQHRHAGNPANNYSDYSALSGDGRFVAFRVMPTTWSPATATSGWTCS